MKHILALFFTLALIMSITRSSAAAEQEAVTAVTLIETATVVESAHPYASDANMEWVLTAPEGSTEITLLFSADTETESDYDYIYITDSSSTTQKFTGTQLAGRTITLPGRTCRIRLASDGSVNKYGFCVQAKCTYSGIAIGSCGDSLIWTLDTDGTLTISGTGEMDSYHPAGPWYDYKSSVKNVIIRSGVTNISNYAFNSCSSMTSISIPDSVTRIGWNAFDGCSSLKSVSIPQGVTCIEMSTFQSCTQLERVSIPSSVLTISNTAFQYCSSLSEVSIAPGLTTIKVNAFNGCRILKEITLPDTVTQIESGAFQNCGLTSFDVPTNVECISQNTFYGCNQLACVTIPAVVNQIQQNAFYGCTALTDVYYLRTQAKWDSFIFYTGNDSLLNANLHVTGIASGECGDRLIWVLSKDGTLTISGSSKMYSGASWESYLADIKEVVILPGVKSINIDAFRDCSNLTSVSIPASVIDIGTRSFYNCSSLTSITVAADNPVYCSDANGVLYSKDKTTLICVPGGMTGTFTVPAGVSSVEMWAIAKCGKLTEVDFGQVKTINQYALRGCTSLTSIRLSTQLTSIDEGAFWECSSLAHVYYVGTEAQWEEVSIQTYMDGNADLLNAELHTVLASGTCGENLTWILNLDGVLSITGTGAMPDYPNSPGAPWNDHASEVKEVVIGSGITNIGNSAFAKCVLMTTFTISESVTVFPSRALIYCQSLTKIIVSENSSDYSSDLQGVLYNKQKTELLYCPPTFAGEFTVPAGVTRIGNFAFEGCGLTGIQIPDSVTTIGNGAFGYVQGLTEITIPDSVTTIGNFAFRECSNLKSITIPNGITYIDNYTFQGCKGLESISIPDSITFVHLAAFTECSSLKDVYYQGTQEQWDAITISPYGNDPLQNAAIHFVRISSGTCGTNLTWELGMDGTLTISGNGRMTNYTAQSSAPWYGDERITSIAIEDGVTSIGSYAFNSCTAITSATIADSVVSIGGSAFRECSALADITIPESVASIGTYAFYGCTGLKTIELYAELTSISSNLFDGCSSLTAIALPETVSVIGASAFNGCSTLTEIVIPESVMVIDTNAFCGCTGLETVNLSASLRMIGNAAFSGCSGLKDIFYSGSLSQWISLEKGLQNDILTNALLHLSVTDQAPCLHLPQNLQVIETCAFEGVPAIIVEIPDGVAEIAEDAFTGSHVAAISSNNPVALEFARNHGMFIVEYI